MRFRMSSICHGFPPFPVAFEKTRRGRRSCAGRGWQFGARQAQEAGHDAAPQLARFRHAAASLRIEQRGKRKQPSVRSGAPGQRSLRSKGNWSARVDPSQMASVLLRKQEPRAQPQCPCALGSCLRRSTSRVYLEGMGPGGMSRRMEAPSGSEITANKRCRSDSIRSGPTPGRADGAVRRS